MTDGANHGGRTSYELLQGGDALERARESWLELERSGEVSYFQSYAMAKAWYETLGQRVQACPQIVLLREDDQPVGLFPACVIRLRGVRVLTWLGLPDALDSGDVVFDSSRVSSVSVGEFVEEALTRLQKANGSKPLLLSNVREDAAAYPALRATCRSYPHGVVPVVEADCDPDSYDETLSPSLRKTLRRKSNKLQRDGGYRVDTVELGDDASFALLRGLLDLKRGQRDAAGLQTDYLGEEYFAFLRKQTKLGTVGSISTLVFNERVIAGIYDVVRDDSRYLVLIAFDPDYAAYSPGLVLNWHVARAWPRAGTTRIYNLGWGGDAYKYHWNPREASLNTFVGGGLGGAALLAVARIREMAMRRTGSHEANRRLGRTAVAEGSNQ